MVTSSLNKISTRSSRKSLVLRGRASLRPPPTLFAAGFLDRRRRERFFSTSDISSKRTQLHPRGWNNLVCLGGESHFMFYVNLKYCGTNLAALREYLVIKHSSYTVKKTFTKPFRYWKKPMLTRDFFVPFKERIFCLLRRERDFFTVNAYSLTVIFQNARLIKNRQKQKKKEMPFSSYFISKNHHILT